VVVAAPSLLGSLRPLLHESVVKRVVAEIPKALTSHQIDEMERIIADQLAES